MEQCLNCSAGCCRALNPNLIGIDILKIKNALGVSPFMFTIVVPMEGKKFEENLGKTPMFKFKDLQPDTYYKLVLKSIPSPMATTKCIFQLEWLSEEDGSVIGRCGIHGIRPLVCRTFPARMDDTEFPVMEDVHKVYEYKKQHDDFWDNPDYSLCPRPLEKKDYADFKEQYYQDCIIQDFETKFALKLAEKWNENPDVSDNFIEFLEKEYANRLNIHQYQETNS